MKPKKKRKQWRKNGTKTRSKKIKTPGNIKHLGNKENNTGNIKTPRK
ncbi:hypothetical protein HYD73_04120 [Mycoplasmopsis bovis]|nr:hypothetical protein HYD73_04120 [Mycoplasmopsis bovis]